MDLLSCLHTIDFHDVDYTDALAQLYLWEHEGYAPEHILLFIDSKASPSQRSSDPFYYAKYCLKHPEQSLSFEEWKREFGKA